MVQKRTDVEIADAPRDNSAFLRRALGPEGDHVDWMSPSSETGRFDRPYIAMIVSLRWGILVAFVALGVTGLMEMHPLALTGTATWIAMTNALATWYWFQGRPVPWYDSIYLYLDFLSVIFGTLSTANLGYPVWMALVMLMIQAPAERATVFSVLYSAACVGGYVFCAVVMQLAGWYDVDIGIAAVTVTILSFVGLNLAITFDGNRRLRATIRQMAVTDSLTGLANRRQLSHFLAEPPDAGPIAVIVMDIDNFKRYNDGHGHLAGDQMLAQLAQTLREAFPDASIVSRYGGDEFVVLLPVRTMDEAEARVGYLLTCCSPEPTPVSVGLALWPNDQPTLDAAFAAADDCLRAAKRSKRGSYASWSADGHIQLRA